MGGELEAGMVFDHEGRTLHWHMPEGRTAVFLPDSYDLWGVIWENRKRLGGIAHVHPWNGTASPSWEDVTTFAAVEAGLGKRLLWPILTFNEMRVFHWVGPGRTDYGVFSGHFTLVDAEKLLQATQEEKAP